MVRSRVERPRRSLMARDKSSPSHGRCECGCGGKTPLATHTRAKLGLVRGEPVRFLPGHHRRRPLAERFWRSVERRGPDECWPWTAYRLRTGYGLIRIRGKQHPATHAAWELHSGKPVPDGMCLLHRCDNPPCVNPRHLRLGTHGENMLEMAAKGRASKGEHRPNAKLTARGVQMIRRRLRPGISRGKLAREFGVSRGTIEAIARGDTWRHIA